MQSQKNRTQILSAAKKVFIRKGFNDSTMIDIATESGLCRRTIYTYYKSKVQIYHAVIEAETHVYINKLEAGINPQDSPQQKLLDFVFNHYGLLKRMVEENGTLRSPFFRNIWGLEHFRKEFDRLEFNILQRIINEGQTAGVFSANSTSRTAQILLYCIRGFEVPYISGRLFKLNTAEEIRMEAKKIIFSTVGCSI